MNELSQLLYWLTTGLLLPTVGLLLFFLLRLLLLTGATLATATRRRQTDPVLEAALDEPASALDTLSGIQSRLPQPIAAAVASLLPAGVSPAQCQRSIANLELAHEAGIGQALILARVGPMLGLMGTLIPLGPALLGLAEGDLKVLADNMLVAFSTTVIGLLIGGAGFALQQILRRWAAQDVVRVEYLASLRLGREQ